MNPLIPNPDPLGLPVPAEIMLGLKMFGYLLHLLFMNIWLVGIPCALILWKLRPQIAERLLKVMPFVIAFGINAGIVPLLFLQTLFPGYFYAATILQAWFWFMVIPLLIVAYYAIYLAAFGIYRKLASLLACFILLWIGLTFSSSLSLTEHSQHWQNIFLATADHGAVHGLFFYLSSEIGLRYGMVCGLALATLAVFFALDSCFWHKDETYKKQVRPLIPVLYIAGTALYLTLRFFYDAHIQNIAANNRMAWNVLPFSMSFVALLAIVYTGWPGKCLTWLFSLSHILAVLACYVIGRQIIQSSRMDFVWQSMSVRGEWGSLILFLIVLVLGVATLAWMGVAIYRTTTSANPQNK